MHQRSKIAFAALLAIAGTAQAQQAPAASSPTQIERVEITGSRIRQIDVETSQPVQTVTREDIRKSGLVTAGDIVNALTSAGTPDFSKGAVLTSNREQGGQYANLRNLGSQRVLVLVNGKRWSTSINGYTDMSNIPSALIERVEVLKDGASAIYGSDAIAGVVNFILKKGFEGIEASAFYGQNEKGDGTSKQFDLTLGTRSDKASVVANISYSSQGVIWAKDRAITSCSYGPDHCSDGWGASPWGRISPLTAAGLANTSAATGGFNQILNHTGGLEGLADGVGADASNPANYHTTRAGDTFNSSSQMMFASPVELKSLFVKGDYDISDNLRFKTSANYAERESTAQVAGYPFNSRSQVGFPVYLDKDSYYNPYGNRVAGAGNGQDLFVTRRVVELPRVTQNNAKTLHLDTGLEGDFTVAGKGFNWDVGVLYDKTDGVVNGSGNLNLVNLKSAMGPSFLNSDGVVQCGTAAKPIPLTQCTPFNIIGGPSASTPAALAYVNALTHATYGSTITSYQANIGGSLLTLPAGELGASIGAEYRRLSGHDTPDLMASRGYTTDLAGNPTDAKYNIKEVYGELNIPVLKGMTMAEQLDLNLATRYSDYSNFGSTTNSKASFKWKPVKDLLFRGTIAEGFRAPTIGDTFGGGQQSFDSYYDPCDTGPRGAATGSPTVAANCLAKGVPANFRQINQAGSPVNASTQGTAAFNAGAGNATLTPETALTKTLGFVFSPSQVQGLTVGVDWYRVDIKNVITSISAQYVLDQCYVQNNPTFCASIQRDPSNGMVTYLERGNLNLAQIQTEGIDVSASYQLPRTSFGQFRVGLELSYLTKYRQKATKDSNWDKYEGEWPYYRVKANLPIDWSMGDWGVRFMTRYFSSFKDQCWDVDVECTNPDTEQSWGSGYHRKSAQIFNDLSVTWKSPWKGVIQVGANNLFDIKPRINYQAGSAGLAASSAASVDPNMPVDRFMYVRYTQSF